MSYATIHESTPPAPKQSRRVAVSVYGQKSARAWDGVDETFIDLTLGEVELSGATYAWRELAAVLNEAIAAVDEFERRRRAALAALPVATRSAS